MGETCRCAGRNVPRSRLVCLRCGERCCRACSFASESATYCARCAEIVLDAGGLPLNLVAAIGSWSVGAASTDHPHGEKRVQWMILVARDQPELLTHLARAFAGDDQVEVIMDRRKDHSRNLPGMKEGLSTRGAVVIKRSKRGPSSDAGGRASREKP